MTPEARSILEHLERVAALRRERRADAALEAGVRAVKAYQHARFERSYADLLAQPRYARAARFFLDDLYGPHDFTRRDDQFARIVPALVRLFPAEIVRTVHALAELHALSETLDTAMARALAAEPAGGPEPATPSGLAPGAPPAAAPAQAPDAGAYARAWRRVGDAPARERQIALMLSVGEALERYTRNPLLRHSLRLMRGPAGAAGLSALQAFLETGFDTFREMRGASEFLATIASRERALAAALFSGDESAVAARAGPLVQLP